MAKPRKCSKCGQKSSEYTIYKDKTLCNDCIEDYLDASTSCSICGKRVKRKLEYIDEQVSNADKKKTFCSHNCYKKLLQDRLDMEELDLWLKNYHRVESLNSRIYMQINQFVKKNNYTYKGILLTLQYYTLIQKKDLQIDNISIVSWYYDSAKEDFIKKQEQRKKAQELQEQNFKMFNTVNTISTVKRDVDTRRDEILITDINFN